MSDLKISEMARKVSELEKGQYNKPFGYHVQLAINEACRPLVEALKKWEVQDEDGNYPDERADYTPTLSPVAQEVLEAHRKEHER